MFEVNVRSARRHQLATGLLAGLFVVLIAAPLAAAATPAKPGGPTAPAAVDPALLAGMAVRSIGPAGMSGRVAAIDAVESDPNVVYVGAATGGVWKSTNGGLTWKPVFDDQPVAAIGAVAVNQQNPAVVWVGTGESNVRNSASVGNGVYRSLDGGETWQHVGLDATERIARIVLDPRHVDTAWVAAMGREWGENPERGVFKTTDGGKSWTRVLYVDEKTGCADLAIDPSNPNKLIAAMWQYRRWPWFFESGGPGSGLFSSLDGGATWKKLQEEDGLPAGELGRIGVAFSRSNPAIVYALVEAKKAALLRSEDGGKSWEAVNTEPNVAPRPFYYADIRVDPKFPDRVYSLDYVVRVSADAGKTFAPAITWSQVHGDYHAMWIDPADPDHFYVGDDGGVAVTRDGGKSNWFVANLPLAQFYHVAVDMDVPYNLYGGLQDNSSWRGPSALWQEGGIRSYVWDMIGSGDGFNVLPDATDSLVGYSLSQGGELMRWNLHTGEIKGIRPPAPQGVDLRFNWNTGLAVDPFAPSTVYLGSQFVHQSTDRGETWKVISPDLTSNNPEWQKQGESGGLTPDVTAAENFTTILDIAPSPIERGTIWVGTDDGRLHVTRDGGATWTSVEKNVPGVPANTWIPQVRPSRHAAGTAFVVFDDHRRSNLAPYVYRTDDYGRTWRSLATAELSGYALAIEQDPVDPDLLFLGTEYGLWVSLDAGKRWMKWKHGLPTVSVMDLVVQPRDQDLVIATHGRALYVLDDVRALRELSAKTQAEPVHLFAIGDAQQHWNKNEPGGWRLGAGEYRGENRPYGAILTYSLAGDDLPLPDRDQEKARQERERQAARAAAEKAKPGTAAAAVEKAAAAAAPTGSVGAGAGEATKEAQAGQKSEAKSEAKAEEKVTIEIADATGKVVRTLRYKPVRGVNRQTWDLGRDAFDPPPPTAGARRRRADSENPSGPEVPPGTYQVTVKFRGQQASQTVKVVADPRAPHSAEEWQRRWQAIERAGADNDRAVAAVQRIRRTRADVEAIAERVRQANEKAIRRGTVKADELPLIKAGKELGKGLDQLEKRLWISPDTVGIPKDETVMTHLDEARGNLTSSWDPPNPTHLALLDKAEGELAAVSKDLDAFYADRVAAYRRQVAEAKVTLLPESEPATAKEK